MKNLIMLESSVIAQKRVLIHTAITLASFILSLIVWELIGGSIGSHLAWAIVSWIPLISFMQISKKIEKDTVKYVQSRIPKDIELCSEQELITQISVRNDGCVGFAIKDGRPMSFERFESEDQRELAAKIALGWVAQVESGIKAKRNRES